MIQGNPHSGFSAEGTILWKKGEDVASAAELNLGRGNIFTVTGTTNITSIKANDSDAGKVLFLIFAAILTFTDGSNLKLAGNFVTSADDVIALVSDGTNWFEISRSVN